MKIHTKFGIVLIALCILVGFFLKLTVKADDIPNNRMTIKTFAMTKAGTTEISTEAEMETIEQPTEVEAAEPSTEIETIEQNDSNELQTENAEASRPVLGIV